MWELTTVALVVMAASALAIWLLGRREMTMGESRAAGFIILGFAVMFLVGLVLLVGDLIYRIYTG